MTDVPAHPLPAEEERVHTRIMKCALEVEDARAYWKHVDPDGEPPLKQRAFDEFWFGARSMDRVAVLLLNFRVRFAAYPEALRVLSRWRDMEPTTRVAVSHWHLQLADPLYRAFTGEYLPVRREALRSDITRPVVITWVSEHGAEKWTAATRIQFASKLLSAARAAGLVTSNRDPRPLATPRVGDDALTYLLYLLRGLRFAGTVFDNPYLASVGLIGKALDERLRGLSSVTFRRQGDLVDLDWRYPDLAAWATATIAPEAPDHDPRCAEARA